MWSLVGRDGVEDPDACVPTRVLCAKSTSLTSSRNLAFMVWEFPSLPILSKLIGSTISPLVFWPY